MARLIGAGTDEEYARAFTEYYGRSVAEFTDPADIPDVIERLAQLTEPGQFFEHGEVRFVLPNAPSRRWRSPASAPPGPGSRPTR